MIIPGGIGDVVYRVRDAALRWVAQRRGLIVPSLLADIRPPAVASPAAVSPDQVPSAGAAS
jgi:hypothetical protein